MESVPASPAIARSRFTSVHTSPERRVAQWQRFCQGWVTDFECRTITADEPVFEARGMRFPRLGVTRMSCSANLMERTAARIRSCPSDTIAIGIVLKGSAFVYHAQRSEVIRPGEVIVYDPDTPAVFGRSDGFVQLGLSVPRAVYAERYGRDYLGDPRIVRGRIDVPLAAYARTIDRLVRSGLSPAAQMLADDADVEERALELLDLVAAANAREGDGIWVSAGDHIVRGLHDPALSVPQIASAVGVSERHLSRVFARRGTTVAGVIAELRLTMARDLLLDPRHANLPIGRVGELCGFASSAHFARAFRRRFGASATELRGAAEPPTPEP